MISLKDYLTASGRYPERQNHKELSKELLSNAATLLSVVNPFLEELGIEITDVSSGFRPSDANSQIKNAAKRSLHMRCLAIDLYDPDGVIDAAILKRPELLDKYGLWLESPEYTKTWSHLDLGKRSKRKIRVFIP